MGGGGARRCKWHFLPPLPTIPLSPLHNISFLSSYPQVKERNEDLALISACVPERAGDAMDLNNSAHFTWFVGDFNYRINFGEYFLEEVTTPQI